MKPTEVEKLRNKNI